MIRSARMENLWQRWNLIQTHTKYVKQASLTKLLRHALLVNIANLYPFSINKIFYFKTAVPLLLDIILLRTRLLKNLCNIRTKK